MTVALYAASVPVFQRYLERLRALVDAAEADVARRGLAASERLDARLAPDMFPFATQVVIACNFTLRASFPLAGQAVPPDAELAPGFDGLRAHIAGTAARLDTLEAPQFESLVPRIIDSHAGQARVSLPAAEFLLHYALPNFFFHLSMAYAILRSRSVAVGKQDFDGWHVYR